MSFVATFPSAERINAGHASCCGIDPIIHFSISPHRLGGWYWETRSIDGVRQDHGLSPTRKLAAAIVIRHIIQAGAPKTVAPQSSARAA